jgi:hypothetical protein
MKIGFFSQEMGPRSKPILDMAQSLIQSAKQHMPDVEIYHLTDGITRSPEGVTGTIRIGGSLPMAVRRVSLHEQCQGDWLFVDTDIIFRRSVEEVFADPFDVALTDRDGTITNEADYARIMPYNIGVVFSRSPDFWTMIKGYLVQMPEAYQQWEGDQRVVCELMKHNHGFNVKILPGSKYNYPPKSADDKHDASILHYKGQRKKWLIKEAA